MKYGQIREIDVANGPGIRTSLFVTGCNFNCYNCFNKEYQDFEYGSLFTEYEIDQIIEYLNKPYIKGLSILGGEPMEHPGYLSYLIKAVKPYMNENQDIWVWSGYKFEDILLDPDKVKLLEKIDVLVDGTFQNDKKDLSLKFRGSSNQRIIDVQESIKSKRVIVLEGY